MSRTKKSRKSQGSIRSLISLAVSVGLIGVSLFIWFNKQYVIDWVSYYQFEPSAEIESIASRTTMTDDGKFYFYASKPQVEGPEQFNSSCERKEANSAILGCYANNRIFVYGISNEQLDGIKEVTAAHEMLHAVYQRMSNSEKSSINALLEKEYEKVSDNTELKERMDFYAKYEAGERYNELHSIVATEFPAISSDLEAHYKKYFSDRAALVALHTAYASVFSDLKKQSDELLAQLKTLGPQLETDSAAYNTAAKQLQADIQVFNQKATNGGFASDTALFTSERSKLIRRSDSLDTQRQQFNQNVAKYEQLRQKYNDTAASSQELYKSIDSKLSPSPSI